MAKIRLLHLAHARSGDKGDTVNVGIIARRPEFYPILIERVTAEAVREHFEGIAGGPVERFELPNLKALNFLVHNALDGGGTISLMTDAQGKTFSTALLRMEIAVAGEIAEPAATEGVCDYADPRQRCTLETDPLPGRRSDRYDLPQPAREAKRPRRPDGHRTRPRLRHRRLRCRGPGHPPQRRGPRILRRRGPRTAREDRGRGGAPR